MNGWLEVIDNRADATDHYRERTRVLVDTALEAREDGSTPYEVVVLEVAAAFAGPDDTRVAIMPLTDGHEAGQATLAGWAKADE